MKDIASALLTVADAIKNRIISYTQLYNPYKFKVYKSANNSVSGTQADTVVFDVKQTDTGSCYNTSTGMFTAAVAGWYVFGSHVRVDSTGATYLQLYLGGEKVNDATASNDHQYNLNGFILKYLDAGSTCSVGVYHAGNCNIMSSSQEVLFYGFLLSRA